MGRSSRIAGSDRAARPPDTVVVGKKRVQTSDHAVITVARDIIEVEDFGRVDRPRGLPLYKSKVSKD